MILHFLCHNKSSLPVKINWASLCVLHPASHSSHFINKPSTLSISNGLSHLQPQHLSFFGLSIVSKLFFRPSCNILSSSYNHHHCSLLNNNNTSCCTYTPWLCSCNARPLYYINSRLVCGWYTTQIISVILVTTGATVMIPHLFCVRDASGLRSRMVN